MGTNDGGGDGGPPISRANHSVPIHALVDESQSSHGLRHSDHAQYRAYCSRRLARLRHARDVRKELSHYGKGGGSSGGGGTGGGSTRKAAGGGGRHAFQPRQFEPEESNRHVNYVLVPLYQAERAWSHSMEIKALRDVAIEEASAAKRRRKKKQQSSSSSSRKVSPAAAAALGDKKNSGPSKIRSHQLRRLARAAAFASVLEERAAASCDASTALEARLYASWMRGNLALERADWSAAVREYGMAVRLCDDIVDAAAAVAGLDGGSAPAASDAVAATAGGGKIARNKKEELERRDYFHARAERVLGPLLTYCKYEMQKSGGMDPSSDDVLALKDAERSLQLKSKLDSLRAERLRNAASAGEMSAVSFRGRDVPVENESLRVALLKAKGLKSELDREDMGGEGEPRTKGDSGTRSDNGHDAKFLALLSAYDEAAAIASDDLKEYMEMKAGPAVNARRGEAERLVGYVKYQKLRLLMRRNEQMVEDLRAKERAMRKGGGSKDDADDAKRAEEIAHILDALLQDARAVASLPGGRRRPQGAAAKGGDEEEEDDDEFAHEAEANLLRIRALRAYYVARLYASPAAGGRHAEAAALLGRARSLASLAAEEIAACQDMEDADARVESMAELEGLVEAEMCRTAAAAYLSRRWGGGGGGAGVGATIGGGGGGGGIGGGVPFLRRLDDFDAASARGDPPTILADVPPLPEPIPCRPTFFDVALNYVGEFPADELAAHVEAYRRQKRTGGLLSWFTRG